MKDLNLFLQSALLITVITFTVSCSRNSSSPHPTTIKDTKKTSPDLSKSSNPYHYIESFNKLISQVRQFIDNKIPPERQAFLAGITYNSFLKEAIDPNSGLSAQYDPPKEEQFSGVGMGIAPYITKIEEFKGTFIVKPFREGSFARQAGLRNGDIILGIDDEDVKGMDIHTAVSKIKGLPGTQVKLKVFGFCDNQEKDLLVTRGQINHYSHWFKDSRILNINYESFFPDCEEEENDTPNGFPVGGNNDVTEPNFVTDLQVFYVPLKDFNRDTLCDEFIELQKRDLKNPLSLGMIIDLRGNPGGRLEETVCMLNTLISSDKTMVNELPVEEGVLLADDTVKKEFLFTETGFIEDTFTSAFYAYNRNIVVLVNGSSASASEIFAGTVQEMKRGWVVGSSRTFGKGTIQIHFPMSLSTGSRALNSRKTTGIYTLNSGRSPQGYGIVPDFHFTRTGEHTEIDFEKLTLQDQLFFNSIKFNNNIWTQNRPVELAQLNDCLGEENRLNRIFRERAKNDDRYKNQFGVDFQIELAKDILTCSPVVPPTIELPPATAPFETRTSNARTYEH